MSFSKLFAVALLALSVSVSADAAVTNMSVVNPDNSNGSPQLDGFVTNDILLDFTGQHSGAQMLLMLDTGSIYQEVAFGGTVPVSSALVGAFPYVGWDTFVANGSERSDQGDANPAVGGGAVDLGGEAAPTFDTSKIDQSWNPAPGDPTAFDRVGYLSARVSLSQDANGVVFYLASAAGEISTVEGTVVNGVMSFVPEPTSFVLLGLGMIGLVGYRRRK